MPIIGFNADISISIDTDNDGRYDGANDISTVYNSLSYIKQCSELSGYESAVALVKALYAYSESARAYKNNK